MNICVCINIGYIETCSFPMSLSKALRQHPPQTTKIGFGLVPMLRLFSTCELLVSCIKALEHQHVSTSMEISRNDNIRWHYLLEVHLPFCVAFEMGRWRLFPSTHSNMNKKASHTFHQVVVFESDRVHLASAQISSIVSEQASELHAFNRCVTFEIGRCFFIQSHIVKKR